MRGRRWIPLQGPGSPNAYGVHLQEPEGSRIPLWGGAGSLCREGWIPCRGLDPLAGGWRVWAGASEWGVAELGVWLGLCWVPGDPQNRGLLRDLPLWLPGEAVEGWGCSPPPAMCRCGAGGREVEQVGTHWEPPGCRSLSRVRGALLTCLSLLQHPSGPPKTPERPRGDPRRAPWRAAPHGGIQRTETPWGGPAMAPAPGGLRRDPS